MKNCIKLTSGTETSWILPPRPQRLSVYPESLKHLGILYEQFTSDSIFWQEQVRHYWRLMNINTTKIQNVMDMNAYYGGFSASLSRFPMWMMNIVPVSSNNTLSAVYDRGLLGAFHDWCEPFSTYSRTYDLLHAPHIFSLFKDPGEGCLLVDIMLEMDSIIHPQGFIIIRDIEPIISRSKVSPLNSFGMSNTTCWKINKRRQNLC